MSVRDDKNQGSIFSLCSPFDAAVNFDAKNHVFIEGFFLNHLPIIAVNLV